MQRRKGDPPPDARQVLARCMDSGQTGELRGATTGGARLDVYVMMGEILAARSSRDDEEALLRLRNGGYLSADRVVDLTEEVATGEPLAVLLDQTLPEAVLASVFFERYRQNLYDFLGVTGEIRFTALEAVFVENIQVGHDSRALLDELATLRVELAGLESAPASGIGPGPADLTSAEEGRILELCSPGRTLADVLAASPLERSRTLAQVASMLANRTLALVDEDATPTGTDEVDLFARKAGASDLLAEADLDEHTDEVSRPAQRPPARPPTAPPRAPPVSRAPAGEYDELAAFADHDTDRGDGSFVAKRELLDKVSLDPDITEMPPARPERRGAKPPVAAAPEENILEMEEADPNIKSAVSLNFSGPKLLDEDARHKLEVVNEVLATVAQALDEMEGAGVGTARVQLLVESTSGPPAALFANIEVQAGGRLPIDQVLRNMRKRPVGEHRRLLNRGLSDIIERALSLANENLDNRGMELMLEQIAGYQGRLGI